MLEVEYTRWVRLEVSKRGLSVRLSGDVPSQEECLSLCRAMCWFMVSDQVCIRPYKSEINVRGTIG